MRKTISLSEAYKSLEGGTRPTRQDFTRMAGLRLIPGIQERGERKEHVVDLDAWSNRSDDWQTKAFDAFRGRRKREAKRRRRGVIIAPLKSPIGRMKVQAIATKRIEEFKRDPQPHDLVAILELASFVIDRADEKFSITVSSKCRTVTFAGTQDEMIAVHSAAEDRHPDYYHPLYSSSDKDADGMKPIPVPSEHAAARMARAD